MRHNKHRLELHDGNVVDLTNVSDDEVVVQLPGKTGFARISRDKDSTRLVKFFNTPRARVTSSAAALQVAVALIMRQPLDVGDDGVEFEMDF